MGNLRCQKLMVIAFVIAGSQSLCCINQLPIIGTPKGQPMTVSVRAGETAKFTCTRGCGTYALWKVQMYNVNYTETFDGIYPLIQQGPILANLTLATSDMADCSMNATHDYSLLLINVTREHHQTIITCGLLLNRISGMSLTETFEFTSYNGDSFRLLIDEEIDTTVSTPNNCTTCTISEPVDEAGVNPQTIGLSISLAVFSVVSLVLIILLTMIVVLHCYCQRQNNQDDVEGAQLENDVANDVRGAPAPADIHGGGDYYDRMMADLV